MACLCSLELPWSSSSSDAKLPAGVWGMGKLDNLGGAQPRADDLPTVARLLSESQCILPRLLPKVSLVGLQLRRYNHLQATRSWEPKCDGARGDTNFPVSQRFLALFQGEYDPLEYSLTAASAAKYTGVLGQNDLPGRRCQ